MDFRIDIKAEIKKVIQIDCPICYREYDGTTVVPMLICLGQHSVCKQCIKTTFNMLPIGDSANCPICNEQYCEEWASKFRLMDEVVQITKYMENYCQLKSAEFDCLKQQNTQLNADLINQKKLNLQKDQELCQARNKIIEISKQKSREKINYYVKLGTDRKKDTKTNKNTSVLSINADKTSKIRHETTRHSPFSDFYDDNNQILKPKMNKKCNKAAIQSSKDSPLRLPLENRKNKVASIFAGRGKPFLPYFIHEKSVTAANLYEMAKNDKKNVKITLRQSCIDVLKKYDFSSVSSLNLSKLDFTETYFSSLSNKHTLFRLLSIDLSNNRISIVPQVLFELKSLKEINLNHNNISQLQADISVFKNLQKLLLWNNRLSTLPEQLCSLTRLREIQLSNNLFHNIPRFLILIRRLKVIDLFGNPLKWTEENYEIVEELQLKSIKVHVK